MMNPGLMPSSLALILPTRLVVSRILDTQSGLVACTLILGLVDALRLVLVFGVR